jgi:hypothetical protein
MRNFRRFRMASLALVCLGFTGGHVAWAEPAHPELYIEDPYAPHVTNGSTARVGSVVGFVYGEPVDVLALGMNAAVGHRWGRLAIEAEYTYLGFQQNGGDNTPLGHGHRLGTVARYDVIRLGPHVVGPNSLLSVYVEGGAATAWNHWDLPGPLDVSRIVPDDTKRVEGQVGFGITLDHRLQEPIGFPHRVAWFLGWRLAMSPHQPMTGSICRGVSCRVVPMMDDGSLVDRSMLFQSSLAFTF